MTFSSWTGPPLEHEQHELKIHEVRFSHPPTLYYYCTCGKWKGSVPHLRQVEVIEKFMGEHLG